MDNLVLLYDLFGITIPDVCNEQNTIICNAFPRIVG